MLRQLNTLIILFYYCSDKVDIMEKVLVLASSITRIFHD